MTLEGFFTLTEMKNGLSTLARVEELISVMQRQKDGVISNVSDAASQWSTVAGTLAATENKDCLNHFVRLNGLCFLNVWLQEAFTYSNDISHNSSEELINALLESFERLPMGREESTVSGIWSTLEQLLGHRNVNINKSARILLETWNQAKVNDESYQIMERGETCQDDLSKQSAEANTVGGAHSMYPILGTSPCIAGTKEEIRGVEIAGIYSSQSETLKDVDISTSNQIVPTNCARSADSSASLGEINSLGSSLVSSSCQENISITKKSFVCPAVRMTSSGRCSFSIARQEELDDQLVAPSEFKDVDSVKVMVEVSTEVGSPCKSSYSESSNVSSSSSSLSASLPAQNPLMESTLSCKIDSDGSNFCISKTAGPQPKSMSVDCGLPRLRTRELKSEVTVVKDSQYLSIEGCKLRKRDDLETSFLRMDGVESANNVKEVGNESYLKLGRRAVLMPPNSSLKTVEIEATGETGQELELGLECGEIDALEVARKVTVEVEREAIDYREPFSSSPSEVNSGELMGVQSPGLVVEDEQDEPVAKELKSLSGKDICNSASAPKDDGLMIPEKISIDPESCELDTKMQQSTAAQESNSKIDRNKCDFDLNEDACAEEFDCSMNPIPNTAVNFSVPIAVIASKGAPVSPVAPLQFEGELGWRGSAATSAFRIASPRRTQDGLKVYSSPKRKAVLLQFDLNVAEGEDGDDADVVPTSFKRIPVSAGFASGDSSIEVSSRRAERLKLDLNRLGDEDVPPCRSSNWRFHEQNGDQSPSLASASSSIRDFDLNLNNNPSSLGAGGYHNPDTNGRPKLDSHVITIMGSGMTFEGKDYTNGGLLSFPGNGPSVESTIRVLPYAHMPYSSYGYSRLAVGPAMPFPPALHGPVSFPYLVDSRAVMPQTLRSEGLSGAHSALPPFLTSVATAPSSLNRVGSFQSGLDLNSSVESVEWGSQEAGSSQQLLVQRHYGLMGEQAMVATLPVVSEMMIQRKEPECGWEPYSFGYNHVP